MRRVPAYPRGRDWLFAPAIAAQIARADGDVLHVQSYHTLVAPIAMATAARRRIPYVVTFHGGGHSQRIRERGSPLAASRCCDRCSLEPSALVAIAPFEIAQYSAELRIAASRFALIPNGVDLAAPPASERSNGASGRPLIASVGRLERYKGHQRVIAALPHVLALEPDARLWVAGSGPYEPELRRLVAELGLADKVEISAVAADDRATMARRLSHVDLVVLLSDFETHPIAALEAISVGRPLLVGSGSGLGDLAGQRAGPRDRPPGTAGRHCGRDPPRAARSARATAGEAAELGRLRDARCSSSTAPSWVSDDEDPDARPVLRARCWVARSR